MEESIMKKLLFIASAFILAMTVSCNKAIDPVNPSENGSEAVEMVEFSFPATREMTKSYLDGNTFKWEMGDMVAVCYGSTVAPFKYDPEGDKFVGTIDAGATGPFSVIYPYNSEIYPAGDRYFTTMPSVQVAGDHNVDSSALICVGQVSDLTAMSAGVDLKNMFVLYRVTVTDSDVESISIEYNCNENNLYGVSNANGVDISSPLAGDFNVNPANCLFTPSGRNTAVTLKGSGATIAPGTYDIAVLPHDTIEMGMKVVFKRSGEDMAYYKKSTSSKSLVRNTGLDLGSFSVAGIATRCWYIQSAADLQAWNASTPDPDDVAYLAADIDMSGQTWNPRSDFQGMLDGQGHRIYNITATTDGYCGFIKTTADGGTARIKNIVIGTQDGQNWDGVSKFTHSGSTATGSWNYVGFVGKTMGATVFDNIVNYATVEVASGSMSETRIGGICGNWASTADLKNCANYGEVSNHASTGTGTGSQVAGVVAQVDASVTIDNCCNYGYVLNENPEARYIGGVIANSGYSLTVKNCINSSYVRVEGMRVAQWGAAGGLIGYVINSTVENCGVYGSYVINTCDRSRLVSNQEWRVPLGGFIGYSEKNTIENCYIEYSEITSNCWCVGGFVGNTENATLFSNCVVDHCTVTGYDDVGGFVGYDLKNSNFDTCFCASSSVSGHEEVGGFCGYSKTGAVFTSCRVSESEVESKTDDVGGIVGWCVSSTLNMCESEHNKVLAATNYAGGIVGLLQGSTVKSCQTVMGDITATKNVAGGIVGYVKATNKSTIQDCLVVNYTNIRGVNNVGGIIGWLDYGDVKQCRIFLDSAVIASGDGAGGIIGRAVAKSGNTDIIDSCLADSCTVTGKFSVGGILGYAYPDANGPVKFYNCGVRSDVTLTATGSDSDVAKIGGIIGWGRCTDAGSSFHIVNCCSNASICCQQSLSSPAIGGAVGTCATNGGTCEIHNFSTSFAPAFVSVGGAAITSSMPAVGTVCGEIVDNAAMNVSDCYFITGLNPFGTGSTGVTAGNMYDMDSTSLMEMAPAKLSDFVMGYTDYPLVSWMGGGGEFPMLSL